MPENGSSNSAHRTWIAQARLQSDEVDRLAAQTKATAAERNAAVFRPNSFPGYELEREIHRGAQGVVYRALQLSTGRRVALKLLHDRAIGGPLERARFEREMRVLAALKHPNIVSIHDGGNYDGRFFLVMDYIAGQPLDAYMAGRMHSVREALETFLQICDAVNDAHMRGIIHRDLKPANVRVDESGRPFVLDFGLAKLTADAQGISEVDDSASARTLTGQFLGSLPWAAPEQIETGSSQVDIRTDVYSLGVLLFQMLTGTLPYPSSGSMKEAMEAILHAAPLAPRSLRSDIDDDVETIILKCLSKERERRYQSAGELARDVRRYLEGEPITARPASRAYHLRKFARRNKGLVGGVAAAFGILLVSIAGISLALVRATRAEQDALRSAAKATSVSRFLQNMLAGIDPDDIGPGALTVREVLDHAAARLERELVDQPEIAASLHQTLGNHYSTLGHYSDADRHLRKAVELRRSLSGGDDAELADALNDLAANLQDKREMSAAEEPTREALEIRGRLFGHDSLEVAESLHALAVIYIEMGRAREAEPLLRKSLDVRRLLLGMVHADVATNMSTLGWCLMALGRLDDAETAVRNAVEMVRRLPGDNEPTLAGRLTFLSNVLRARDKFVEEEAVVREAISIRSKCLGPDHPALAWNLLCLAQVRWKLGDFDESEATCRQALEIYVKRRGPQHFDVADCHQLLAQLHDNRGRYAEAEPMWRACLQTRRALLPAGHPEIVLAEQGLTQNLAARNNVLPTPVEP